MKMLKTLVTPDLNIKIKVDALMKPVLIHLWNRGVPTRFSCAGHFPDFKAYIQTGQNADFEAYAKKSPWLTRYITDQADRAKSFFPKDLCNDTRFAGFLEEFGKAAFPAFSVEADNGGGYSRKNRDQFLRWLLEY